MSKKIPRYVDVAVPLPLREPLTYRLPDGLPGSADPGARAVVPVGRRFLTGVIVKAHDKSSLDPSRVKEVRELPDTEQAVPADIMSVAEWASRYYVTSPGSMFSAVLPPDAKAKTRTRVTLAAAESPVKLEEFARAPRQRDVIVALQAAGADGLAVNDLQDRLGDVSSAVTALARKGVVLRQQEQVGRRPAVISPDSAAPVPTPTSDQQGVLGPLLESIDLDEHRSFLLMGVTGSGKTEVFIRAIERCLSRGKNALYLVPEITLTPILARNLKARLGPELAILHSGLGKGERRDEWHRVRDGSARIVLGPRSAVLSPVRDLGLIVVDEEQDTSYKQQEDPRYNARDLAVVRGQKCGATVVLGSATPAVESYHSALSGRYSLLQLPGRILNRPMARVRLIDMRERAEKKDQEELISEPLAEAVREKLARKEQAIILLNRRGFAPYLLCHDCGENAGCRHCSVALTYHRAENRLRCHYCGFWKGRPAKCGTCGSEKLILMGAGTERLEDTLNEKFPEARIARLDRDSVRGRAAPESILSAFEKGEFNLLVGTQMVAKGHDFPGVTIVGVIGADNALALPEFRAAEKAFQLLTQVAGRSGRGDEPGEVVVQAYYGDHYALQAAMRQDYGFFYEKESRFRRVMKYPPFAAMANLIVSADSHEAGVRRTHTVDAVLRDVLDVSMTLLGPAAAPVARIKGRYRYQFIVKAASRRRLSDVLNEAANALSAKNLGSPRDVTIDIDPMSLI